MFVVVKHDDQRCSDGDMPFCYVRVPRRSKAFCIAALAVCHHAIVVNEKEVWLLDYDLRGFCDFICY